MVEAMFHEARMGLCVLSFDGRVLELFREDLNTVFRYHTLLVAFSGVGDADRRGNCEIEFVRRSTGKHQQRLIVPESQLPVLAPVLDALRAAG